MIDHHRRQFLAELVIETVVAGGAAEGKSFAQLAALFRTVPCVFRIRANWRRVPLCTKRLITTTWMPMRCRCKIVWCCSKECQRAHWELGHKQVCQCGVPQFQLPQRTPGQTRQARDGRRGPPGGAWAGPGAHCGVGPAWVLGLFVAEKPNRGARWSAERHSLLSSSQVAKAPYCALLSAQPRPAAGRAT